VPCPLLNPAARGGALVRAAAGDLLLWDSRLIHCNTPPLRPPAAADGQSEAALLRAVVDVCMTPRRLALRDALSLRRRAVLAGVGSTHWPHCFTPNADPALLEGIDERALEEALRSGRLSRERYNHASLAQYLPRDRVVFSAAGDFFALSKDTHAHASRNDPRCFRPWGCGGCVLIAELLFCCCC